MSDPNTTAASQIALCCTLLNREQQRPELDTLLVAQDRSCNLDACRGCDVGEYRSLLISLPSLAAPRSTLLHLYFRRTLLYSPRRRVIFKTECTLCSISWYSMKIFKILRPNTYYVLQIVEIMDISEDTLRDREKPGWTFLFRRDVRAHGELQAVTVLQGILIAR